MGLRLSNVFALTAIFLFVGGCGKSSVDKALESDANGYICSACNARFYTERKVFANRCPACKGMQLEPVMGYVCPAKHVTLGGRGRGARVCGQCGAATVAVSIPKESELKTWGATKRTATEVGVN